MSTVSVKGNSHQLAGAVSRDLARTLHETGWAGWDPFDGLASPISRFLQGKRSRQALVQLHRRSPVNLRPLFGIRPRLMAKTAALGLLAANRSEEVRRLVGSDVTHLRERLGSYAQSNGGLAWWGYDFPVQTRWASYSAGAPNAVVTSFAAQAFLSFDALTAEEEELLVGVGSQLADLRATKPTGLFFRYVPDSPELIFNATALAAYTLGILADRLGRSDWQYLAFEAANTVIQGQTSRGGWAYGDRPGLAWEDGFHTAYVLLSLNGLATLGYRPAVAALRVGVPYLIDTFVTQAGAVRYYAGGGAVAEAHNAGTVLRALIDLKAYDPRARAVAPLVLRWAVEQLWLPRSGHFACRRGIVMQRIRFPRWSDGHMLLGIASMLAEFERGTM